MRKMKKRRKEKNKGDGKVGVRVIGDWGEEVVERKEMKNWKGK